MKLENFYSTSDYEIKSVGIQEQYVYDIEVEDNHNFFGNNILLHNSVWGDAEAGNLLKAALDSYEERVISWISARTINVSKMTADEKEMFNDNLDDKILTSSADDSVKLKFPSEFAYEGRIIFISNLTIDKLDAAVLNRSAKIDMTLTNDQIFYRMESVLEHLGSPNVGMDIKREILQFIKDQTKLGIISAPSMRTYISAEDIYRSGLENWKDLLAYV